MYDKIHYKLKKEKKKKRNYYHGDTEFQSWKELPRLSSGVLHSYRLETAGDWSVLRTQASSYQARFWKEPTCVS